MSKKIFSFFCFFLLGLNFFTAQKRKPITENSTAASHKAGAFIDVNASSYPQSSYSIEDLIKKVLISGGSDCAQPSITNVQVSPNLAVSSQNRSWGYFNRGTTSFPYKEGILLSTGYARKAGNSYISSTLSDQLGTGSDPDLVTAINPLSTLRDATYVEFDFVPFTDKVTFNYLFASEEYASDYPCGVYSDGFALLLKKQGDANYINLAKLPNGTPVSVTNIIPATYSCGPLNAQYFGSQNTQNIETNFNGRTVSLTASANVIPGATYHFKMVLADADDYQYDSAVFLEAGSFNIGVQFQNGSGDNLSQTITMCDMKPQTLVAVTSMENVVYKWYFNSDLIPGVTGNTYVATVPGTYKVEAYITTSVCPIGTNEITIKEGVLPIVANTSLNACSATTTASFNLTQAQSSVSSQSGVTFKFYENLSDAEAGNANVISPANNYTSASKTVYARVSNNDCYKVAQIQLNVVPIPPKPTIISSQDFLCSGGTVTLTSSSATGNIWSTGETTQSIVVSTAGVYRVHVSVNSCTSQEQVFEVKVQPVINVQISGDLILCEGGTVQLSSNIATGNVWNTGATTQTITVNQPGTYSVTITSDSGCKFTKSVTVTASPKIMIQIADPLQITCTVNEVTLNGSGTTILAGDIISWTASGGGNIVSGGNTLSPIVDKAGTYQLIITRGKCTASSTINVVENKVMQNVNNTSLNKCSYTATSNFNLTTKQSAITTETGVTFKYYENLGDANSGNNLNITTPTNYVSGAKKIYVRVQKGTCYKIAELDLFILVPPAIPVITSSMPFICESGSVVLTSSAATGNVWSTGETTQSITVTAAGMYTVKVISGECTSTAGTFQVKPQPDINLQITGDTRICSGESIVLTSNSAANNVWSTGETTQSITVNAAGTYSVSVTTASGCKFTKSVTVTKVPDVVIHIATPEIITCAKPSIVLDASATNYQTGDVISWAASNGGTLVSGANTLKPTVSSKGIYTLTIKREKCSTTSSINVTEDKSLPVVSISADRLTICEGESVTITASGADVYNWNSGSGTANTQTFSPTQTTTYSVSGSGINGCFSTPVSVIVTVVPKIESTLEGGELCEGDTFVLDAGFHPTYTYLWNTGETTQTIAVTKPGIYSVTIDNGVCSDVFETELKQTLPPEILEVLYSNDSFTILAKSHTNSVLEYSVNGGSTWQSSNIFTGISKNTSYSLAVRTKNTSCITIVEYYTFYMNNVITPNGDGVNDTIDFTGISKYDNFQAKVYDRQGNQIFKADPNNAVWNGKENGRSLSSATYWYIIIWNDPVTKATNTKTGWVFLKVR